MCQLPRTGVIYQCWGQQFINGNPFYTVSIYKALRRKLYKVKVKGPATHEFEFTEEEAAYKKYHELYHQLSNQTVTP